MKHEVELKLQAWLDGQLPPDEVAQMARLVATDAEARALHTELKHTRAAVQGFESDIKLPESREFYWSKIARAIKSEAHRPVIRRTSWVHQLRRILLPAGAAAALLLIGIFSLRQNFGTSLPYEITGLVAESDTFTFTDENSGTTLVWFSYSDENELAETDESDSI